MTDGVPVMLLSEVEQTQWVASASLRRSRRDNSIVDRRAPGLHLESLGISDKEKDGIVDLATRGESEVDPVASFMVGATCGYGYEHMIGKMKKYPIPSLRLPEGKGERFLDLGCNWGRWTIAAARKGYEAVGIDPSLGSIMAARRVAKQLKLSSRYLVADARFLPFKESSFDAVFSYSVLQHFSKENVRMVLPGVYRVLKPGGVSLIQMPNVLGLRSLQNVIRRGFRTARNFEVRYWTPSELQSVFSQHLGDTTLSVDCYFGLGLQKTNVEEMPLSVRMLIGSSEFLRRMSLKVTPIKYAADSLYVRSVKCILGGPNRQTGLSPRLGDDQATKG